MTEETTYLDKQGRKRFTGTKQLVSEWLAKNKITRGSKKEEQAEAERKRLEQSKKDNRFSFRTEKDPKKHDEGVEF
ncbi:MAG: hypothetical protein V1820_02545 [archaeon]